MTEINENTSKHISNIRLNNELYEIIDTYARDIIKTYINNISIDGTKLTFTDGNNKSTTLNTQDTTYDIMKGATLIEDGISGLVPKPSKGYNTSFLRGDGIWSIPIDTTYEIATEKEDGLLSAEDKVRLNKTLLQPIIANELLNQNIINNILTGETEPYITYNLGELSNNISIINITYPKSSFDNDTIKVTFRTQYENIMFNLYDSKNNLIFNNITYSGDNYYRITGIYEYGLNQWIFSYDYINADNIVVSVL